MGGAIVCGWSYNLGGGIVRDGAIIREVAIVL